MNEMLQASLVAGSPPEGLRLVENGDFPISEAYTLEWTETDLDRFIELRPANNYSEHSAVIARFETATPSSVCIQTLLLSPTAGSEMCPAPCQRGRGFQRIDCERNPPTSTKGCSLPYQDSRFGADTTHATLPGRLVAAICSTDSRTSSLSVARSTSCSF